MSSGRNDSFYLFSVKKILFPNLRSRGFFSDFAPDAQTVWRIVGVLDNTCVVCHHG